MKKKIIVLYILTLLIFSCTIPISSDINIIQKQEIYSQSYPQDFEFLGISGGFSPLTTLYKLHINSDGEATYSKMYPQNRATGLWTIIINFDFTEDEMNQIWEKITLHNFFDLNNLYKNKDVRDGTYAEMTIQGDGITKTVKTENTPIFGFDQIIKKVNELTPGNYDLFYNAIFNIQPDQPSKPTGTSNGKPGTEYTYTSTASDYNNDIIYYLFNWGDGTDSGWVGPYNSSETGSAKHKWTTKDDYNITVKAKDDPNADGDLSDGQESIWSEPLTVSIPKSKDKIYVLFEKLVQRFPIFNVLQRFHNFYLDLTYGPDNKDSFFTFTQTNINQAGGTVVTIKNCTITVTINIQIRGPGATVQLTKDIEKNIEDVWNAGNWKVKCKADCDPREPGCDVKFDAVVVRMPAGEFLPGFHDITIVNDNSEDGNDHVSEVTVRDGDTTPTPNRVLDQPRPNDGTTTTGTWDNNEPANTFAHEAGHLMGLDDTYPPYRNNFGDHIMNDNGAVKQEDIDLIVGMSGVECPCECCPEENDTEDPEVDIDTPQNGSSTSSPVNIEGTATDYEGSGVAELDFRLEWSGGYYNGPSTFFTPPEEWIGFVLGPIYLESFIGIGDWITIIIYAIDDAGNIGSDEVTIIYEGEEDNIPPVTEKFIGEPNEDGGYIIWPFTPIILSATDEGGSGVNHIYYEIAWDIDEDGIWDQVFENTVYDSFVEIQTLMYGIEFGLIELRWYAVDNANNVEEMHYQQHFVTL